MQTKLKICKLYLLLSLGLSSNASPVLYGLKTTPSNYQQDGSSFHHESSYSSQPSYENIEIKSTLKSSSLGDEILKNTPGITTTFKDQNGNLVTQVKKETFNSDNGQSARAFEFQESKQFPNGYSKSLKKEFSSSSVTGSQPTTFVQTPLNVDKYYNSDKLINGQHLQNYQGSSISGNSDYVGIKSNLKSTVEQSNVPGITTTFTDQNGNLVTQVKKETVNNDNGQNSHVVEFEETKQLPNGYSKSFKKEYSSSSVSGSQPTTFIQTPLNVDKYYNSEKLTNGHLTTFGQSLQNHQEQSVYGNTDYVGIKSNLKSENGQIITNVPGITTTFRDQNGNLVTQVKKETVNNDNGQNSQVVEFKETKQLPNGYSKSFKKEYSSSSVAGYQPTTFVQTPLNVEKYYNSDKLINEQQSSTIGQSSQSYQGSSVSGTSDYAGIKSNLKFAIEQPNVPGITTTFRDQNGNLVTQVKKEAVNNDNGQNSHVVEFEETKQLPNGYSKSFKKEYSSTSVSGSQPTIFIQNPVSYYPSSIKDTTTEMNILFPQNFSYGQTGKLNGYNTFFNNQKYHLNSNGPINSQITDDKQLTDDTSAHGLIKINSFGYNTKDQTDCDDTKSTSSSLNQGFKQQIVKVNTNPKSSSVIQTMNYPLTPKIPTGKNFEKTESYSMQKQEKVGQQSVDLHGYLQPLPTGQQSVNIDSHYTPQQPSSQKFEKTESYSTQTQEVGQQSVDLHGYLQPSPIGQQPVNIDSFYTPKKPSGQKFEKTESFSTQKQEEVGQQSVDLHGYLQPSPIGQQPVNIDSFYTPKKPSVQKFEKTESFSTQKQEEVGQQSVDLHGYLQPLQTGQQSVNTDSHYTLQQPSSQKFEKTESYSTQTQGVGQQSVDLHGYLQPSSIGQQPVNIDSFYTPKKPSVQKFEKTESFSTQKQEEVGQQSVDLHGYLQPLPTGQQSVNTDSYYTPQQPSSQKFEKTESYSTQTQEVGQQSVDLHGYLQPSSVGQQPVNIDSLYTPKKPSGQKFEKIESSYQNKHNSIGQEPVTTNDIEKLKHHSSLQPISGQQIQGLEFLTSKYGDTTHLLDLGVNNNLGQQPSGQQIVGVYEGHSTLEKNIDLSNSDHLPINIDNYKESINNNHQTLHGQSMKSKALQGQQTVDFTGDFERPTPTYQKYGNGNIQTSQLSSITGKLVTGKDQPIKSTYNSVFDKLGQLEHEILGATNTVNINKDNFQTSYSTNHNVKSMPVQTSQQQGSHFLKAINEDTQYIEPESEIVLGTNGQMFSSSSFVKESKSVIQESIENQTSNNEHFSEEPTTQSSVWKKIGDKFKGTIQNAKSKAQQLASTINDKVGFLNENVTETPC